MRPEEESQGPVIRDRRRIDPVTGQVRNTGTPRPQTGSAAAGGQPKGRSEPAGASADQGAGTSAGPGTPATGDSAAGADNASGAGPGKAGGAADPAMAQAVTMLAERTADLQRLQAEYANYRKRVERDRLAVREQALANVLHGLLPVLDDIGRAREHGELTGAFKSVGESLEGIVVKLGLTAFGENGDPFDPTLHEALMHSYSADVTEPTAVQIFQPGYKVGERIIRPARVAVAEPGDDAPEADADDSGAPESGAPESGATGSAATESAATDEGKPDASDGGEASAE